MRSFIWICWIWLSEATKLGPADEVVTLLQAVSSRTGTEPLERDVQQIIKAAKGTISKATSQMTDAFEAMDGKLSALENQIQASLDSFQAESSAHHSVYKNLTKFKVLVNSISLGLDPVFNETTQQVTSALSVANSALTMLGNKEPLEKLKGVESTVQQGMKELQRTVKSLNVDFRGATPELLPDYLVTMRGKLEDLCFVSEDMTTMVNDDLTAFRGGIKDALTFAVGQTATDELDKLSSKSHEMLTHLQKVLSFTRDTLQLHAAGVDVEHENSSNGFFSRIFQGLFG